MKNNNKRYIEELYNMISPFEFKDKLIDLASYQKHKFNGTILDAGRGNPNWTSTTPRQAFFTFGQFAVSETQRVWCEEHLGGMPERIGISKRLEDFISDNPTLPGIDLIYNIYRYGIEKLNFNSDDWVFELVDGIIGDNYPVPDRSLKHIEKVIQKYVLKELCCNNEIEGEFEIFNVEGGTAAMCYIFDSLFANKLLNKGDKIALMTPIFTPYLEIPHLPEYEFEIIHINANEIDNNGNNTWQYTENELEKLKDTSIKALFIVNPNNPASIALSDNSKNTLINIVKEFNPNLMIVTDDVYGTFVQNFRSLMYDLPFNTIGVYSFSKYFGVTGWRLGIIALHKNNLYNKLLKESSNSIKDILYNRYKNISPNVEGISFIDRIVADSRHVALNHTAGLSTPQQVQMAFFCAFSLVDTQDTYKNLTIEICKRRKELLYKGLNVPLKFSPYDASYYTEFDFLKLINFEYGETFANYIESTYKPVDILYTLANEYSIVLLGGDGFNAPKWSFRISLANLNDKAYLIIGKVLRKIIQDLYQNWKNNTKAI